MKHGEGQYENPIYWLKSLKILSMCPSAGADSGFLEVGFRCVKEVVRFADFLSHFLKYPIKMK